jgi:hypothetical protein
MKASPLITTVVLVIAAGGVRAADPPIDDWIMVDIDEFGAPARISPGIVHDGYLYAGTYVPEGGAVWRTLDGAAREKVSGDGFGDVYNAGIYPIAVFEDCIYAGTSNQATGGEIWRSPDGTTWDPVVSWDGRDDTGSPVASGVYYCRLNAGKLGRSATMVLSR